MITNKLFTYGTLRQGERNHHVLCNMGAKYLGTYSLPQYEKQEAVYDWVQEPTGKLESLPVAVYTGDDNTTIIGELYDLVLWDRLDYFEWINRDGSPDAWYERAPVQIPTGISGEVTDAFIYLYYPRPIGFTYNGLDFKGLRQSPQ